jgi:endonuclease/exonuclease/phosphatase family metal-dependent hydrolase
MTITAFENLFISIPQGKGTPILIGVVYRPPGSNLDEFNNQFDSLMENLTTGKNNKKFFLTGDFNIDLLAFDNHAPTNDFIECMTVHHFFPLILQPTRITSTTATLIDNTFTNSLDCIIDSAIVTSEISDHLPIKTWIQTKPLMMQNMGGLK